MRTFLLRSFLFALPILLLSIPLDRYLSERMSRSHTRPGEIEVWKDIFDGNATADVAIYGSSRAWVHFDTRMIQDSTGLTAYNFGMDGHSFHLQHLRHIKYREFNAKPSLIILSVDPFSFNRRSDLYGIQQFLPFMLGDLRMHSYLEHYEGYSWPEYWIPVIRYIGRREAWGRPVRRADIDTIPYRWRGYKGMDRHWSTELEQAKQRQLSYTVHIEPEMVDLCRSFLQSCANEGIKVVLVCTPEYIEGQKFIAKRNDIIALYNTLAQEQGLLFLDYSNDPICQNRDLFYNSMHMNIGGATMFTAKLIRDLKEHHAWPAARDTAATAP